MGLNTNELFGLIFLKGRYDDFIDYAAFMMMEKRMSFFNSALIIMQKPGATYVETERIWYEIYGRMVNPEATPIVIMQPFGPVNFVYDVSDTNGDYLPSHMRTPLSFPVAKNESGKYLTRFISAIKNLIFILVTRNLVSVKWERLSIMK